MNWLVLVLLILALILSGSGLTMAIMSLKKQKVVVEHKIIECKEIVYSERNILQEKEPFQPRDLRGIYFYCYDDCVPVLSRHLKEGEEPVVMHFGMDAPPYREDDPLNNSVNDNTDDRN